MVARPQASFAVLDDDACERHGTHDETRPRGGTGALVVESAQEEVGTRDEQADHAYERARQKRHLSGRLRHLVRSCSVVVGVG